MGDEPTTDTKPDSRLVFLPSHVYSLLIKRFYTAKNEEFEAVADYLANRSSDEFLAALNATYPEILEQALSIEARPDGDDIVARLAVRLHRSHKLELFGPSRQALAKKTIADSVTEWGWMGFLVVKGIEDALPGLVSDVLQLEIKNSFPSLELIYDWHSVDLSSQNDVAYALGELEAHADKISNAANSAGLWSQTAQDAFSTNLGRWQRSLHDKRDDIAQKEEARAEYYQDEWRDHHAQDRYEHERGRFSDVDE